MRARPKISNALRAADLMRAGSLLMQMHDGRALSWFLVPGGEVTARVAAELLARPDVQSNYDGLFPGISQTFRLKRPQGQSGAS
jgi:hypothetical protein